MTNLEKITALYERLNRDGKLQGGKYTAKKSLYQEKRVYQKQKMVHR